MISLLNSLGAKREPFIFIIDFELSNIEIYNIFDNNILFDFDGICNTTRKDVRLDYYLNRYPIEYNDFLKKFLIVQEHLKKGDCYLLNLSFPTDIETNLSMEEIFHKAKAKFRFYLKDKFCFFSPERFIKISNNKIYTYPMKGTIDASIPNAKDIILNNQKEFSEHLMVVDLLRNDINIVAKNTTVESFRYITNINAGDSRLLQVSSKIVADLDSDWQKRVGEIIISMLPAGSISGTPKKKVVEIIKTVEGHTRGYFSGVCGYFDGNNLDSAIMIRFVEKYKNSLIYKSGAGITVESDAMMEYNEIIQKVYI
jgi:para-aminobenzoate synthetase component 1